MKLQLKYMEFLSYQPSWWQNFIYDVEERYGFLEGRRGSSLAAIKYELELHGCIKVQNYDLKQSYLEFEDGEKATWFILKYS